MAQARERTHRRQTEYLTRFGKHARSRAVERGAATPIYPNKPRGALVSTELIGILNLVVVLAALTLGTLRGLRTEMRSDLGAVRGELRGDILAYDDRPARSR